MTTCYRCGGGAGGVLTWYSDFPLCEPCAQIAWRWLNELGPGEQRRLDAALMPRWDINGKILPRLDPLGRRYPPIR